jgi:hypothetical protein
VDVLRKCKKIPGYGRWCAGQKFEKLISRTQASSLASKAVLFGNMRLIGVDSKVHTEENIRISGTGIKGEFRKLHICLKTRDGKGKTAKNLTGAL